MNKKGYGELRILTQGCECCHEWIDQRELAWDLDEDRLICIDCYNEKSGEQGND